MRWISSYGGPLILLPREALHLWYGAYTSTGDDDVEEEETDYWQISEQVTDYAEVVDVRGRSALGIAEGGSPTCFVQPNNLFVQVLATTEEPDVVSTAIDILPTVEWQHFTEWLCEGPVILFDSASYGQHATTGDYLEIDLLAAKYAVRCAYREPDSDARIWVALTQLTPLS